MTVSQSTKNDLLKLGYKNEKVSIIPEGIDFEHWKEEDFSTKSPVPTFIYVGRYARYKGIDATLKAFGKVKKEYGDARLLVIGKKNESYLQKRLYPICRRFSLSHEDKKDVDFRGFVSDEEKLELMSQSHCLIFPSLREGWGLIITEAAAVGTPSIVFDSAGTRDAVDGGRAGYLCKSKSVDSIVSHMRDIIEGKDSYGDMRKRAYEFSKKFHWDNTGRAFDDFMRAVEEESNA